MNAWRALLLGGVQGLTEFLPISSSGHLALLERWLAIQEPTLFFNVFLHAASLMAIIIFFWPQIIALRWRDYWLLGLGSVPVAIAGLLLESSVEAIAASPLIVGLMLIATGAINFSSQKKLDQPPKKTQEVDEKRAILIGLFQSLAILPGISRSGTTLLGGLSQQLAKQRAFTFTFLLGIPAILGANLLQIFRLATEPQTAPAWPVLVAGSLGALVASLLSLSLLKKFVEQSRLRGFGWYCLLLGSGVIVVQLLG